MLAKIVRPKPPRECRLAADSTDQVCSLKGTYLAQIRNQCYVITLFNSSRLWKWFLILGFGGAEPTTIQLLVERMTEEFKIALMAFKYSEAIDFKDFPAWPRAVFRLSLKNLMKYSKWSGISIRHGLESGIMDAAVLTLNKESLLALGNMGIGLNLSQLQLETTIVTYNIRSNVRAERLSKSLHINFVRNF